MGAIARNHNKFKGELLNNTAVDFYKEERFAIQPEDLINVSDWGEKYVVLQEPSEIKGPLRLKYTPYLVPILNSVLNPATEKVVLCKPTQSAGTTAAVIIIGYFAHQHRCSIMFVLADERTATFINDFYIQPLFENSPVLSELIDYNKFSNNEILLRNKSLINMAWASSVSQLASKPMRIVVLDEIDKPGYSRKSKEASAVFLAEQRTESFYDKLIFLLSTPTMVNGNIWQELINCDVIYDWQVPCPHCGRFQPLRFNREHTRGFEESMYLDNNGEFAKLGQVVWQGGSGASKEQLRQAGYECGTCEQAWSNLQKNNAVSKGVSVARVQGITSPRKVGFHVNRLYSLLGRSGNIGRIAEQFLEAKQSNKPGELQGIVNNAFAEPWADKVIEINSNDLIRKAKTDLPAGVVPDLAVALTLTVDNQKYEKWYVVRAWANDYTSWLIDYGRLVTFEEIETLIYDTTWSKESGGPLKIWRAAIDTGGGSKYEDMSMTEEVYHWLRSLRGRGIKVWPTKGSARPLVSLLKIGKPLDKTPSGKPMPKGFRIMTLDSGKLKDIFVGRLQNAIDDKPMGAFLHKDVDKIYINQITAEEKQMDNKGVVEWVQVRKDNHLLDCEAMQFALVDPEFPGINLPQIGKKVQVVETTAERKPNPYRRR